MENIVAMARAAQRDDRLADGALYGKLADEIERLRKGIQSYLDGDSQPYFETKHDKCPHGRFQWEDCGTCTDEYFARLLHNVDQQERNGEG